jgi:IS5 family transposase
VSAVLGAVGAGEDRVMQGRSLDQPELLDAASVAGHLVEPGSVFALLAAHRRVLFPEAMFADLFPSGRGRPSVPVEVAASVLVLQTLHGLSDREAMAALRTDLRWKVACGLAIGHGGYDSSVLTYWRRRLAASTRPDRIFEAVKEVVAETGVLKGKARRALDSTVLDDAVATQDTVTQLIAAIRRVAREVPGAAAVVADQCRAHDYTDAGKPAIAWDDEAARAALVDALVGDAIRLLAVVSGLELGPAGAQAVALLALVAGQDVEPVEDSDGTDGRWRIARGVAKDRVISVVDPEARHAHKSVTRRQDGFKAHLVIEPDTGIVTGCAVTKAAGPTGADGTVGVDLLAEDDSITAPVTVLGDSAYATGSALAVITGAGHRALVKPWRLATAVPGGFSLDDFLIDQTTATATCPNGLTRPITRSRAVTFGAACRDCPLRSRCTDSPRGRKLQLHPHEQVMREHRARAKDPGWQEEYRRYRPMVERSIAWLVTGGNRRLRFRGTIKNDAWLHNRTAVLNLRRLLNLGLARTDGAWTVA